MGAGLTEAVGCFGWCSPKRPCWGRSFCHLLFQAYRPLLEQSLSDLWSSSALCIFTEDTSSLPGNNQEKRYHQDSKACWSGLAWGPEDRHRDLRRPLLATGILGSVKHRLRKHSAKPFLSILVLWENPVGPEEELPKGKNWKEEERKEWMQEKSSIALLLLTSHLKSCKRG